MIFDDGNDDDAMNAEQRTTNTAEFGAPLFDDDRPTNRANVCTDNEMDVDNSLFFFSLYCCSNNMSCYIYTFVCLYVLSGVL